MIERKRLFPIIRWYREKRFVDRILKAVRKSEKEEKKLRNDC